MLSKRQYVHLTDSDTDSDTGSDDTTRARRPSKVSSLKRRTVTFRLSKNKYIKPKLILTEEVVDAFWWKRADLKIFRDTCVAIVRVQGEKLRTNLDAVYDACTGLAHATTPAVVCIKECLSLSDLPTRGLEIMVYPNISADRRAASQAVLRTQARLPTEMCPLKRQEILAAASRLLSHQSNQLAKSFASGDACVAHRVYRDDYARAASRKQNASASKDTARVSVPDRNVTTGYRAVSATAYEI